MSASGSKCACNRKAILKFCFSELGLVLIILLYIVGGGFLFRAIEHGDEKDKAKEVRVLATKIQERREGLQLELYAVANESIAWNWNRTATIQAMKDVLDDYHNQIKDAIAKGYSGKLLQEEKEEYRWEILSAILFAATILTTIGYGHVAPKSEMGRLMVVLYAVLAVPLMSIFLIKIGGAVGKAIRWLYHRSCCWWCKKRRVLAHDQQSSDEPQKAWAVFSKKKRLLEKGTEKPPKLLLAYITIVYLMIGTIVFRFWEDDWSVVNAIYVSFITLSTIGFGDMVPGLKATYAKPKTASGMLLMSFSWLYIMVGLAVLAMGMDLITGAVEGQDEEEEKKEDDPMLDEDGNIKEDVTVDENIPDSKLSIVSMS